ncbi:MAG TPA: LUD domain-containing protein, partial [Sulfuricaulis sp.]|nr:LUD domain-containing protein [Sulfuricaulis sp.]
MQVTAMHFKRKAGENLRNEKLQKALEKLQTKFVDGRAAAIAELSNFGEIRDAAAEIRDKVIRNLDRYLLRFEQEATARGAVVHWAETADEANRIVAEIAHQHGLHKVVKSKSMVSEECGLNDALES